MMQNHDKMAENGLQRALMGPKKGVSDVKLTIGMLGMYGLSHHRGSLDSQGVMRDGRAVDSLKQRNLRGFELC